MRIASARPLGFSESRIVLYVAFAVVGMTSLATIGQALDAVPRLESRTAPTVATLVQTDTSAPAPMPVPPSMLPEEPDEKPVDPQECRNVQRQLRDQLREMRRIESLLKKAGLTKELETLAALRAKAEASQATFKGGCVRDALQEFYDEQPWETINELRAKAELPKQHAQIERELKRLERRMTPKALQATGIDVEKLKANVAEIRKAVTDSKTALAAGDYEEANEAMQTIYQGMHPGEVMGVIDRLRELGTSFKRIRDPEVRAQFQELMQPIIDSVNEGDFRDANQALNEVFPEIQRFLFQVMQRRYRGNFDEQLEKLELMIESKLGGSGNDGMAKKPDGGVPFPMKPAEQVPQPAAGSATSPASPTP